MEWSSKTRAVHFIKLLILLAILLWISSFFKPFSSEVGATVTANKIVFVIGKNQVIH